MNMSPKHSATCLGTALLLALSACSGGQGDAAKSTTGPAAAKPGLSSWVLPVGPGSGQPDLTRAPDGTLLLSWMDSQPGRRTRLQLADFGKDNEWGPPRTVAIGSSFITNWADTPHVTASPDGGLWIQWLQKNGEGHAYNTVISTSRNGGVTWAPPISPHDDGTASEHGFASLWPVGDDRLGIAWLDGRNTGAAKPGANATAHAKDATSAHESGEGRMSLRGAVFNSALQRVSESEIDASVCDCCQTAVAVTGKGAVLVYRGRTDDEIRDIQITRFNGTGWTKGKPVAADNWKMPACPVNGPSVAATGDQVLVGWYTAAGDTPAVKLARSVDAGDSFAAPVQLDQGDAVQGRIKVALDTNAAWALWLREEGNAQSLWLARYAPDLSKQLEKVQVAKLQGRGRGTGFPQLTLRDGAAYIVWTDISDGQPGLRGAVYRPK